MTKAKKALKITRNKIELLGLLVIRLKDEILVKPSGKGVDVHWSYILEWDRARSHVTHEKYPRYDGRRHRQIRPISGEKMVKTLAMMFSQPGDPPPEFDSLENNSEQKKLNAWLERTLPKVFHPPTDEPVKVLKDGPAKDFVSACMMAKNDVKVEIGPLLKKRRSTERVAKEDMFKVIRENEMEADGSVLGFKDDPPRIVFTFKEGLVMELHESSIEKSQILEEKGLLGIEGFIRTLNRKGLLPKGTNGKES
jgi:hypothetical protein